MFKKWQSNLNGYYRKIYKGTKISPWHHYQLKVIEEEMKSLDEIIFKEDYEDLMANLRGINI